ncbi:MAG: glycosyl hydrolase family 18 protein [Clostridia bacterium]|nr:glycosyl hydrolase family 18 protein [Clostridia bacterium]
MKKLISLITLITVTASILTIQSPIAHAASNRGVAINVNGKRLHPDVPPFIKNGRTLVPLRGIFEELGSTVEWVPEGQRVIVKYKDKNINLQIGNKTASINGNTATIDVAPLIDNSRTMIPLRFIAEKMGMNVQWVPEAGLATITDPGYFDNLPRNTVLGFTTNDYLGDNAPHGSLLKYGSNVNAIATFSYQLETSGDLKLTGQSQARSVDHANSNNIKPLVLIHNFRNGNFDRSLSHTVLSDAAKRQKLINNILVIMSKEEYAGVNIDIENVDWTDRQNYTALIRDLKKKLEPYGFLTTVSIPAKTSDTYRNNSWSGGFDYIEIGKYADKILLMTYDEHYFGGTPGPIASLPWVENVLKYATSVIDSKKLLLGIPAYGYDWSGKGNKAVTFKSADSLLADYNVQSSWDDSAKSPYFSYVKDGTTHQVWYENSQSLSYKLPLVAKYQLGGIGIWKLGYDNDAFWETIKAGLGQ